ncbi:MAG: SEC-C domain-containing protein [Pseudomonadota bacterium]
MGKRKPTHDDDPGMDLGRTMDGLTETLQMAGYRLDSEKDLSMGMMAYNAAAMVKLALLRREGDRGPYAAARRNDPCPCGSGKKFKKCCLGRNHAVEKPAWKPEPGPAVEPELIPNVRDLESAHRDLEVLAGLFETDPELRKIRYSRTEVAGFAEKALAAAPAGVWDDPGRLSAYVDQVAYRYVTEVEGGKLLESLPDMLTEAARRARGPDDIRSLALGMFYSITAEEAQGGPNPLECMIFRMSMNEQAKMLSNLDRVIEGLGPRKEVKRRFLSHDPELRREVEEHFKTMDPAVLDVMKQSFCDTMERIEGIILEGKCPVPLPQATVFPMLARLYRAKREGRNDDATVQEIIGETLDGLDPEDLRLYGEFLDEWIRSDDGSDRDMTAMVHQVRGMAAAGDLRPLDGALLVATLKNLDFSTMEGEEEVFGRLKTNLFDRKFLDRYADFLDGRGFPALGQRVRDFADVEGRLELPLAGKKEKKKKRKQAKSG